ncbi:Uncharacterised protein [Bordetella pertussis]|nr:Uncharacterised protein [Bordetella pertussis]
MAARMGSWLMALSAAWRIRLSLNGGCLKFMRPRSW